MLTVNPSMTYVTHRTATLADQPPPVARYKMAFLPSCTFRSRTLSYCLGLLAILDSLGGSGRVTGQEVPSAPKRQRATAEVSSQVRLLLLELDADQRARRQSAERELLDLGPAILPALPPLELLPNLAVRSAVARVRIALERRQAQESVQASLINTEPGLQLSAWLQRVEAQSSNSLDLTSLPPQTLRATVQQPFANVPFWQALDDVRHELALNYLFAPDSSVLKLIPASSPAGDAAWQSQIDGPFRIAIDSARLRKVAGNDQIQRLRTELSVAPEPRLRALFLKFAARDFQARGANGQVFPASDDAAQFDLPLGEGGRFVRWSLDFTTSGTATAADIFPLTVQGRARMQVAAGSEHIRFTDLVNGAGTARRRGGVTVAVQKIESKPQPDGTLNVSIKAFVAYETGGPAFESHRTWIFHNEVYLQRDSEERLPPNGGFDTDLHSNGKIAVTYHFQGLRGPLSGLEFVYVAPTLIIDVPVEIKLTGIQPPAPKPTP